MQWGGWRDEGHISIIHVHILFQTGLIYCVRENHEVKDAGAKEPENELVAINPDTKEQTVLVCTLLFVPHCSHSLSTWYSVYIITTGLYFIICASLFTISINLIYRVHHYHWYVLCYLYHTVHISYITLTYSVWPTGVYFIICTSLFTFSIAVLCNVHHSYWCLICYLYLTVHIPYHPDMQCTSVPLVCILLFVPHCSYSLPPWHAMYISTTSMYLVICTSLFIFPITLIYTVHVSLIIFTDHWCVLFVIYTTLFRLCV